MTPGRPVAIRDVRVFDGDGLTEPRTVVVDGDMIVAEAADPVVVDGRGATLLPGLIDAHVHLHGPENLDQLAAWGVTTALDMACWPPDRVARLRASTVGRADFRTAGTPAIGPGGAHAHMPGMPADAVVLTAADAARHVAAQVANGVDYLKAVAEAPGDGGPPPEALAAVVAAAREHGLPTVVHAATVGAWSAAVACGAEFITHAPVVGHVRDEDVAAFAAAGRTAVPTTVMMAGVIANRLGDRGRVEDPLESVAALHAAGVTILAGTDANAAPGAPSSVPHGRSLHDEFDLLVRAGLSTVEVLRAATNGPADAFGLYDRGRIRPGLRADLVLVDGDPVADIRATRAIRTVWCAGRAVDPNGGTTP